MSALTEAIAVDDRVLKIGFGTWLLEEGDERYTAVADALRLGYRRIDTARAYHNEFSVGRCDPRLFPGGDPPNHLALTS